MFETVKNYLYTTRQLTYSYAAFQRYFYKNTFSVTAVGGKILKFVNINSQLFTPALLFNLKFIDDIELIVIVTMISNIAIWLTLSVTVSV